MGRWGGRPQPRLAVLTILEKLGQQCPPVLTHLCPGPPASLSSAPLRVLSLVRCHSVALTP